MPTATGVAMLLATFRFNYEYEFDYVYNSLVRLTPRLEFAKSFTRQIVMAIFLFAITRITEDPVLNITRSVAERS